MSRAGATSLILGARATFAVTKVTLGANKAMATGSARLGAARRDGRQEGRASDKTGPCMLLSVTNLSRSGLGPLSLELAAGECLALRGPSGSGKSLLLRALADLDPNEGLVRLAGEPREAIAAPSWRRRVAYLPAETGWWAETVAGHFADPDAAHTLLGDLALPADCLDWPVTRLSTGERQRLGLIRVLLLEPRVYLLDEPTAALDEQAGAAVERLIEARLHDGAAAIWVTHDAAQADRVADRQITIAEGRLREQVA